MVTVVAIILKSTDCGKRIVSLLDLSLLGPGSSTSFDNSSAGSTCSSDLQGLPTRKNFTR